MGPRPQLSREDSVAIAGRECAAMAAREKWPVPDWRSQSPFLKRFQSQCSFATVAVSRSQRQYTKLILRVMFRNASSHTQLVRHGAERVFPWFE